MKMRVIKGCEVFQFLISNFTFASYNYWHYIMMIS